LNSASLRPAALGFEVFGRRLLTVTLLLSIVACAPLQRPEPAAADAEAGAVSLSARGMHNAAADEYLRLSRRAAPLARQRYLLLAARERQLAGDAVAAITILERLPSPVATDNQLLWSQVAAAAELDRNDPEAALAALKQAPSTADSKAAAELLRLRAEALFRLDQPVSAAQALLEREVWLEDPAAIADNQRLLWASFQSWGGSLTPETAQAVEDPVLAGWLELGYIAWSRRNNPAALRMELSSWRIANAGHPAERVLLGEALVDLEAADAMPGQVALLLPLSGRQQAAAGALRDGFLAAYFDAADDLTRPVVKIYDVSAAGTVAGYQQAVQDGAAFIVGPLLKESVEELALNGVSAPTLALNYLPDEVAVPPGLFQFALAPEDEASQAARRALRLGQTRALALAPDNPWGRRLLTSFVSELERGGGKLLDYRVYEPDAPDLSLSIQNLLLINESEARRERLQANLGIELAFEPRTRDDVDVIFMAATAATGKLIRPQLRFHYAGSLPTYATSAIYEQGSRNNADLNGIIFPDIPWIVAPDELAQRHREALGRHWPGQADRQARLYAMGYDAYRLVPKLYGGADASTTISGMTGTLYLDERSRIHRELAWAEISGGRAVALQSPVAETETMQPGS
jgi:outer membrane PBP1 activator LpoA protein